MAALDLQGHWPWLLKFYRSFRNISQEQFAEIMGRSPETISRWERGHYVPDLKAQIKMRDLILARLDKLHGGIYAEWQSKRTEAGF